MSEPTVTELPFAELGKDNLDLIAINAKTAPTLEQLRNAKRWLKREIDANTLTNSEVGMYEIILNLINAKIELTAYRAMRNRYTLGVWCMCDGTYPKYDLNYDTAYRKLTEVDRPEREPCDWCEAQMQNVMGYVQYGCYRLDASCWNFCPVCGRKLDKVVPV